MPADTPSPDRPPQEGTADAQSPASPAPPKIRRALLSVYDKTGLVDFARALHDEFGIELISTGGTASVLKDAGLPVTLVEEITGFPEMLDGRVKTLHPKIHAAILADRDNPDHVRQLAEQRIAPIDMVVVNLYPFEQTIAKPGCTFEEAIEMIDIGGPCLLRAAAKNHRHVCVVCYPDWYEFSLKVWSLPNWRAEAARYAFWLVAGYDAAISAYLGRVAGKGQELLRTLRGQASMPVRYGENPHQAGETYELDGHAKRCLLNARMPGHKASDRAPLSFNNLVDASAALELCTELTRAGETALWHRRLAGGAVWHRRLAGGSTGETPVPQATEAPESLVAPASRRWKPIEGELLTRRNLPHIQTPGRTYFVTFRVRSHELPPEARDLVLESCHYWHGRKMTLHIATVMPNHVYLLVTPYLLPSGASIPLSELLHSIKSYTSHKIGKLLGHQGSIWLDENFDRVMRDQQEFYETREYIETNAARAGLGTDYRWVWSSETELEEGGQAEEAGAAHRRDVGGTCTAATPAAELHRRDAGATPSGSPVGQPNPARREPHAVCFIKHTNPCGVAADAYPIAAYRRAYLGDPNAAMGGILAVNFDVTPEFAEAVMETYQRWGKPLKDAGAAHAPGGFFVEVWLAPSFDEEAVNIIRTKKDWGQRVRLLAVGDMSLPPDPNEMDFKRIAGGMLMQTRDLVGLNEEQWKVVTERAPSESEISDLRLAWLVCKHTKSNAITICKDGTLIGNGAGQMSRVMSCRIATWLAQENGHAGDLKGAAAASDAFFPFRDGPCILIDSGVTALIQPGGSKRDQEVIDACNARNVAMIFTGTRHFRH